MYYNYFVSVVTFFRGTVVTPYIMLGASDSRQYCAISDKAFRFSPVAMSTEELHSIQGIDERIPVNKMGMVVDFYRELAGRS